MLTRFFLLGLILLFLPFTYAVEVEVDVEVEQLKTTFEYVFNFSEDDNYNSFSFEKTRDAKIILAKSNLGHNIPYSVAGDYFIFRPDGTRNQTLTIIFESILISNDVLNKDTYSSYVNFNIPVEKLDYNIFFDVRDLNNVNDVFPRNYTIIDNSIYWSTNQVSADLLYLINFEPINSSSEDMSYYLLLLLSFPILLFVILFLFIKNSNNKKQTEHINENKNLNDGVKEEKISEKSNYVSEEPDYNNDVNIMVSTDNSSFTKSKEDIDAGFLEFIDKFLTQNEKDVVVIIRENEGISQFDILNHLPSLTKSNLSKIISKLDGKMILKRIKVGKINKIYLGEKLKFASNIEEKEN